MTIERNVKGLLGTKLGMTQLWDENNRIVPVTVIAAGTNVVTQVRTPEKDGYNAIQVGFGEIDGRKVNKPRAGHFQDRRHHAAPPPGRDPHHHRRRVRRRPGARRRHLRRRRRDRRDRHQQGQGLRRCHEAPRLPRCLLLARCPPEPPQAGLDRRLRDPRSRLQGRPDGRPDGLDTVTTQNLTVHAVDADKGLILVKGAIPGPKGGLVVLRSAAKKTGEA